MLHRLPEMWDLQNEAIGQFMAGLVDSEILSQRLHEIQHQDHAWVFWNMDAVAKIGRA